MHINNLAAVSDLLSERNIIEGFGRDLKAEYAPVDGWRLLFGSRNGATLSLTPDLVELVLEAALAKNTVALAKLGVRVD